MLLDDPLRCPYCGGDDLTPDPDPTSLWSCLGCARVFRVGRVGTLSGGWALLRALGDPAAAVAAA
ncbi:MAG: hypothetical protein L0H79_18310 [Intrasporangium sp.]|uniref:hypothetical protein n=1 Tax=Intrasporangium sp. TaxID=1925024 RepID=UPI0026473695|nr:hypothetical protein [Intrasporangium sp.]MDN5797681.1 hypothetical protein [Intrasporangium sp.]